MQTPKYGHAPIKMRRRKSWDPGGPEGIVQLGDFAWRSDKEKRLCLVVAIPHMIPQPPCGGKSLHWILSEWTIDHKNDCNAQWSWDGNKDQPTLSPSLHAVGIWHGHVKNGFLVE